MTVFGVPYEWMVWRNDYAKSEKRWATRGIVSRSDGTVRLVPLYCRDVVRWASDLFDDPFPEFIIDASMEPDA